MNDVINTIALNICTDSNHFIYFQCEAQICSLSLAELDQKALNVARHLSACGVCSGDLVGIMAPNCIEWILLDLAILKLGAVTVGFEEGRFNAEQIISDYGLKVLFTNKIDSNSEFFDIKLVKHWSESGSVNSTKFPFHSGYDSADICAIKFTSGSTGIPKGLEATVASVNNSLSVVQQMFNHSDDDNILVFLRLALLQQRYWIYSSLVNKHNVTLATMSNVFRVIQGSSPTVIMGVPGFYEEVKARLEAEDSSICIDISKRQQAIQALLGGRIRYLWTGSAPASRAVLEFFNYGKVPLYEGYGLNETCIIAKNYPGSFRLGSVGRIVPNKTIRFDKNGILIVASRHPVNHRYRWCAPGVNEKIFLPTAEVKTYDLGHVDEDGFLYIHGRLDDVLTLSNGRNVLVRLIEDKLREHPDVHECVLFGNGRPFLTAVISPHSKNIFSSSFHDYIKALNETLLPEQRVHALVFTQEKFSIENDLLSSQFKPLRKNIFTRYVTELTSVYEADKTDLTKPRGML